MSDQDDYPNRCSDCADWITRGHRLCEVCERARHEATAKAITDKAREQFESLWAAKVELRAAKARIAELEQQLAALRQGTLV